MIRVRKATKRGHADPSWLDTDYAFSWAGDHGPEHMGLRALRVMNEDRVAAGKGFGEHPHKDMEMITYVLGGT